MLKYISLISLTIATVWFVLVGGFNKLLLKLTQEELFLLVCQQQHTWHTEIESQNLSWHQVFLLPWKKFSLINESEKNPTNPAKTLTVYAYGNFMEREEEELKGGQKKLAQRNGLVFFPLTGTNCILGKDNPPWHSMCSKVKTFAFQLSPSHVIPWRKQSEAVPQHRHSQTGGLRILALHSEILHQARHSPQGGQRSTQHN